MDMPYIWQLVRLVVIGHASSLAKVCQLMLEVALRLSSKTPNEHGSSMYLHYKEGCCVLADFLARQLCKTSATAQGPAMVCKQ